MIQCCKYYISSDLLQSLLFNQYMDLIPQSNVKDFLLKQDKIRFPKNNFTYLMCKEYQDEGGYNSYSESDGSESFDDSSNNDSDTDDGSKDGYKDNGSNSDDDSDDSDPLEDSADEDNSGDTESSETDTDSDETSSTNFLKKKKD